MLRPRGPPGGPMEDSPATDETAGGPGGGSDKGGAAAAGPGVSTELPGTPPTGRRWRMAEEAVAAATRFPGSTRPAAMGLAVGVLVSEEDALFSPVAPPEATDQLLHHDNDRITVLNIFKHESCQSYWHLSKSRSHCLCHHLAQSKVTEKLRKRCRTTWKELPLFQSKAQFHLSLGPMSDHIGIQRQYHLQRY